MDNYTGSTSSGMQDDLKSKAQQALSKVQDSAGEQIESKISDGKAKVAGTLDSVASTLLSSSQSLRAQGQADASRYIEKAADGVDRLASYLERADVHELYDQAEGFARRQPAAFMAAAFGVGFLASRFLKSSRGDLGYTPRSFSDSGRSYGMGDPASRSTKTGNQDQGF